MALVEMLMPKMGESIMEATILTWLKKEGEKAVQRCPGSRIETVDRRGPIEGSSGRIAERDGEGLDPFHQNVGPDWNALPDLADSSGIWWHS